MTVATAENTMAVVAAIGALCPLRPSSRRRLDG